MRLCFDIEANDLLVGVDRIHCIATEDLDTGEALLFGPSEIEEGLKHLSSADLLVGHNIATYDIPALSKVEGWEPSKGTKIVDTMLLGNILYPEDFLSLETWAEKLKLETQKVQNEDWSVYTNKMGLRCQADVKINVAVFNALKEHKEVDMIPAALDLEQRVGAIHAKQELHGVAVDTKKGIALLKELDEKLTDVRERVVSTAPWRCELVGIPKKHQQKTKRDRAYEVRTKGPTAVPCTNAKTKTGKYTVNTKKYFGDDYHKVQGPYTKVSFKGLNLNSSEEVTGLLLSLGWKPLEWNRVKDKETGEWRRTGPKLTEESYISLPPGVGQDIAEYNVLKHRRSLLLSQKDSSKGILANAHRGNGIVSAEAFTCGTPTARYRHSGSVCNIPRVTTPYGKELRALFCVRPNSWQVGVDLSGIEARMLAHYLLYFNFKDARKTADLILSPDKGNDFHSYNAKVWGVDRDTAKTCLYA